MWRGNADAKSNLELSGQETDLDKGILDAIAEPLTHLVRNAVSHGIETPEERRSLGKSPRGKIRLNAFHQGNQVVVEISDDGRGMNAQKIRTKAAELGLITAQDGSRLSDAEALELIFRPGFSTAEVVTEVSGRGVGMDVVQSVVHRLKATVQIGNPSRPGHNLPIETATHARHYQGVDVLGGTTAVCDSAECGEPDRPHHGSRSTSGG